MRTEASVENGGWAHPWRWFVARGLGFWALGFGFAWIGYWIGAPWVQWLASGLAIAGMWMLAIGFGEARRVQRTAWWSWYRNAYERNVRAAEQGTGAEPPPPQRPNDR